MQKDKKAQDLCDGLMGIGTFVFLGTWVLAIISWIVRGEMPETLVQYVMVMHGICFASYCCKAAYENGAKKGERKGDGQ